MTRKDKRKWSGNQHAKLTAAGVPRRKDGNRLGLRKRRAIAGVR